MMIDLDSNLYIFKDREDAARDILSVLPKDTIKKENWFLLSLSLGAVPIVELIADELEVDYDLFFVEPIYAPNNDECQVAMVSETEEIVIHYNLVDSFGISLDYLYAEAKRRYQDSIIDRQYRFRKSMMLSDIKDRNILIIDEGCETGFSALCALKSALSLGIRCISLATPVIADDLFNNLDMKVDKIYTNNRIRDFIDVSYYYNSLLDLEEKSIKKILENSRRYLPFKRSIKNGL